MVTRTPTLDRIIVVARWIARLASAALAIGCLALFVHGVQIATSGRPNSLDAWTLVYLGLIVLGAILAWPWEWLGGALLLVMGALTLAVEIQSGVMDGGPWLMLALGAIFLACWGYGRLPLTSTTPLISH